MTFVQFKNNNNTELISMKIYFRNVHRSIILQKQWYKVAIVEVQC